MAWWWVTRERENISHPWEKENVLTQIHEFGKGRCDRFYMFLSEGTKHEVHHHDGLPKNRPSPWCQSNGLDLKLPGFMASAWCAWSSAWRISLRRLGELLPVPWRLRVVAPLIFPIAATNEAMFVDATLSGLKYNDVPRRIWRFWQIQKGCRCSPS